MIHEILPVGLLQCNCSILGDETSREAIVVDPGDDIPAIQAVLQRHGLSVKYIVITHAHIDHIAGAQHLKRLTEAPILYNQNDLLLVKMMDVQASWLRMPTPEVAPPDAPLVDGQTLAISGISGTILHTPGHTQGSVCFRLEVEGERPLLFSGDHLFKGSIGRFDLPGGSFDALMASMAEKILPLDDEIYVLPGHGEVTSIGDERRFNPFLLELQQQLGESSR